MFKETRHTGKDSPLIYQIPFNTTTYTITKSISARNDRLIHNRLAMSLGIQSVLKCQSACSLHPCYVLLWHYPSYSSYSSVSGYLRSPYYCSLGRKIPRCQNANTKIPGGRLRNYVVCRLSHRRRHCTNRPSDAGNCRMSGVAAAVGNNLLPWQHSPNP